MKSEYQKIEIDIIQFDAEDIITTSAVSITTETLETDIYSFGEIG